MIWKNFKATIIVAIVCIIAAFFWGIKVSPEAGISAGLNAVALVSILAVLELSLSFDNATVNASILKHWDPFWQKIFLTVGILIAVFGMRLVFPIAIVAATTDLNTLQVIDVALNNPTEYAKHLFDNYTVIAAFGGIFLWMVFAGFLFDTEKDDFWFGKVEEFFSQTLGKIPFINYTSALLLLAIINKTVGEGYTFLYAGLVGLGLFLAVELLGKVIEHFSEDDGNSDVAKGVVKAGIGGFLYLELIDASFSFDGVIGAFAITNDVIIIMLGLAIGAMAVRCLTVYLVKQGTLDTYRYLESGAMYAVGALSLILLLSQLGHLPEVVTGSIGLVFILSSLYCSIKANKKDALNQTT